MCKADLDMNSLRQNQTQEFSFFDARDLKFDCEKGLKLSKNVDENYIISDFLRIEIQYNFDRNRFGCTAMIQVCFY